MQALGTLLCREQGGPAEGTEEEFSEVDIEQCGWEGEPEDADAGRASEEEETNRDTADEHSVEENEGSEVGVEGGDDGITLSDQRCCAGMMVVVTTRLHSVQCVKWWRRSRREGACFNGLEGAICVKGKGGGGYRRIGHLFGSHDDAPMCLWRRCK